MRAMSDADLSVLEASLKTAGSSMITGTGSANDALWSALQTFDWMHEVPSEVPLPFPAKIFTITDAGRTAIAALLADVLRQRRDGPDLAAPHSSVHSDTTSMNR